ncbi:hypothetical protein GYMLUDRAFT_466081 [Collybiopsis luxurians FD-317 M1]|uniref:Uncharacterized protein n=1 Tax=Collybiopsis luxurians FD-317 M1 TaxID=944289 RepID=A0A0D0C5D8_9AGAR|nr:hypothetical protein GYMLUDRAFT_466081 [Collybiopsis luxurians FD-317 M1]
MGVSDDSFRCFCFSMRSPSTLFKLCMGLTESSMVTGYMIIIMYDCMIGVQSSVSCLGVLTLLSFSFFFSESSLDEETSHLGSFLRPLPPNRGPDRPRLYEGGFTLSQYLQGHSIRTWHLIRPVSVTVCSRARPTCGLPFAPL